MNRKTKCPDRKRRALHRCAWLVVILVILSVTRLISPLPWMAIRQMADKCDVESPNVVDWFYDGSLPVTRFALHALVDGENSMMLGVTGFHLLMGWYDRTYVAVETWDGSGLYAGVYQHSQQDRTASYLFGRIDDPSIKTLRLAKTIMNEETWEEYRQEVPLPEQYVMERGGKRYILVKLDALQNDAYCRGFELTGYDAEGDAVITMEPHWQTWSTA